MQRLRSSSSGLLIAALVLLLSACSAEEPVADFVEREKKLYSQGNEELLVRHFFGDRRGGVFLDVGSFEWKRFSTTYYLEKHLGWSGIAIDANAKLATGFEKHRPATSFHAFIVTDHSGTEDDFYLAGPVSSTSKEHIEAFDRPKLLAGVEKVPTITLDLLLEREGIEKIDFLSMDIELGEPAALAGFDIQRFRPELVCIEAGNATVREQILPYFEANGYERIEAYLAHDRVNWYFKPRS